MGLAAIILVSCLVCIACVCLLVVSNTYYVVFLFCLSSSCVLYVASFSEMSIFDCSFVVLYHLFTPPLFIEVSVSRQDGIIRGHVYASLENGLGYVSLIVQLDFGTVSDIFVVVILSLFLILCNTCSIRSFSGYLLFAQH